MRAARTGASRERAQAAAELAVVLPVLFVFLGGIFVYGRAFVEMQQIAGAANEGARRAIVSANEDDRHALVEAAARAAAEVDGLDPDLMTVTPSGAWTSGDEVTVTVTYPLHIDLGPVSIDETITRERTMRVLL